MTLIAIRTRPDGATILSDTGVYPMDLRTLREGSKVDPIPHLDMVVTGWGGSDFGRLWKAEAAGLDVRDFDEHVAATPVVLRQLWDKFLTDCERSNIANGETRQPQDATVISVGPSAADGEYRAWCWSSEFDFGPVELGGMLVRPSLLDTRPCLIELADLCLHIDQDRAAAWAASPEPEAPQDDAGWVALAQAVRRDRSLVDPRSGTPKVIVAGRLYLTEMRPGRVTIRHVHTFDDTGEELEQMVRGTLHPAGQAAACLCDSGKSAIDCCISSSLNGAACPCGSGAVFDDCCSIGAKSDQVVEARVS